MSMHYEVFILSVVEISFEEEKEENVASYLSSMGHFRFFTGSNTKKKKMY